jgi:hypothetical protein
MGTDGRATRDHGKLMKFVADIEDDGTPLIAEENLDDLPDIPHARENLGLKIDVDIPQMGVWPTTIVTDDGHTFELGDKGKTVTHESGDTHNFTIPLHADVEFPEGTFIHLFNGGGGGNLVVDRADGSITLIRQDSSGINFDDATLNPLQTALLVQIYSDFWFITSTLNFV